MEMQLDVTYRYGVRGASVDVQGGGVVVGNGSSGQCCWRGEANCVAAIWETCDKDRKAVMERKFTNYLYL